MRDGVLKDLMAGLVPAIDRFVSEATDGLRRAISAMGADLGGIAARLQAAEALSETLAAENVTLKERVAAAEEMDRRSKADLALIEVRLAKIESLTPAPLLSGERGLTIAEIVALVDTAMKGVEPKLELLVTKAVAALPPPANGKDADMPALLAHVEASVASEVAKLPVPQDGKSVEIETVRAEIAREVEAQVAKLPVPQDGKSVEIETVRAEIAREVETQVAKLPVPRDGKSVEIETVRAEIAREVASAVAALPAAKDGLGIVNAEVDREGRLVLVRNDGSVLKPEGTLLGPQGFALEDLKIDFDGERMLRLSFERGTLKRSFDIKIPTILHRGVYDETKSYERGDEVTCFGSTFRAIRDNPGRPETVDSGWVLSTKKGRDYSRDIERKVLRLEAQIAKLSGGGAAPPADGSAG